MIGHYHVTWVLPFVMCSVDVTKANARDSTENERDKVSKLKIYDSSFPNFKLIWVVYNLYAFPENTCEKSFPIFS